MSFLNKVAIITGAGSGMGASIAMKLATEGALVTIVDLNQTKLAAVAEKCEQHNNKPLVVVGDVTKEDDVANIISGTVNKFGKLNILINSAGIGSTTTSILSPNALKEFDRVMATNIRSIVNLTNLAGPHLISSKGNIINISSTAGLRPLPNIGFAYNTSKAALDHFTRCVAVELATKGVRVNGINPGPVQTDILKNSGVDPAVEEKMWDNYKRSTLLGRVSEPEEIADLVMFLVSDKARGITGASFVIDNGNVLKV